MPRATPPSPEQEALLDKAAAAAVARREVEERLETALTDYYAALIQAYSAGLRFSQIAERVGTSGEAVRRIIARELKDDVLRVRHQAAASRAVSDPDDTVDPEE